MTDAVTQNPDIAPDDAAPGISFPRRLLTVTFILTILTFAWLGWAIFDSIRDAEVALAVTSRVEDLKGVIVHLDEVLTMSARMGAATGDPGWEARYRTFEPQLDAAIKETRTLGDTSASIGAATRTDEANVKLVEMETRAFALVRAGRKEEAQAVLASSEYETQKAIYAEGITSFINHAEHDINEDLQKDRRFDSLSVLAALVVGGISFAVWLSALRGMRRWRVALERSVSERTHAERALRQAHDELEVRVHERTGELADTNKALRLENTERERAEEVLLESEEKFRELAENITDVFWIHSPDLRQMHYISPAYELIWGRSTASWYAHPEKWSEAILPEDRERVQAVFLKLADEPNVSVEYQIARPDGSIRWIHDRGFQVRDATGRPYRTAGIAADITERKQAEAAQARLVAILEATTDLVSISDPGGQFIYINRAGRRMIGLDEQVDITTCAIQDFLPNAATSVVLTEGLPIAARDGVWSGEAEFASVDGRTIPISQVVLAHKAPDGTLAFLSTIARDITERKRIEQALRASEAKFRRLLKSNIIGVMFWNLQGDIFDANDLFLGMVGYGREDLREGHLSWKDLTPPEYTRVDEKAVSELLATGTCIPFEKEFTRKDGHRVFVLIGSALLDGQKNAGSSFVMDITERKRAEQRLRLQYAVSRVLAESSTAEEAAPNILRVVCDSVGWDVGELWSVDQRAGVLRCVETWSAPHVPIGEFAMKSRQMTFASGVGLAGRVWASGQPAWIADVGQDGNFRRALVAQQHGLRTAFAFPISTGSGVSGVIELFSRERRDPDEELLRTFAVLGSQLGQFVQHKQLEDQLVQSQKLETVGKLAGGVAHEFNSLLTAIIGHSDLLLGDLPSGSPLCISAIEIRTAADRAAALTRQLLAYGRKQLLRLETLDLNHVIASMEEMLRHLMGGDVNVSIRPAAGLEAVKADAGQIEQVTMNIALNARDAMPDGGTLTMETANVTIDMESVGRDAELTPGAYAVLSITDTGTGMSAEVRARVFDPFFTTKGVGQGTGLGLATCYGIVKQSGGHLSVYSEPGRGTTFKIYLPQVQRTTEARLPVRESPGLPRGSETILLVDDDPALRDMAAELLRRLGYVVLVAADGVTALSLVGQRGKEVVDLLLTDVVMPNLNGKDLSDRVLALHPETRILFTSAYTENAIVHQGVLNSGVAFLQKPFTPSTLALKVRDVLDAAPSFALLQGAVKQQRDGLE